VKSSEANRVRALQIEHISCENESESRGVVESIGGPEALVGWEQIGARLGYTEIFLGNRPIGRLLRMPHCVDEESL
jgi:hypothetical protein